MSNLSPLFLRDEELDRSLDLVQRAALMLERAAGQAGDDPALDRLDRLILQLVGRRPGITPSELDALLGAGKQTLSRRIKTLRAAGLVETQVGPADRRTRPLRLTEAGQERAQLMAAAQRRRLRAGFQRAGAPAVEGFLRVAAALAGELPGRPADVAARALERAR